MSIFDEPIRTAHHYKDNYNKHPIEFGDTTFEIGEIHLDKRTTEFKADGTQLHTYEFICSNKPTAWTGKPIDEGFKPMTYRTTLYKHSEIHMDNKPVVFTYEAKNDEEAKHILDTYMIGMNKDNYRMVTYTANREVDI